MQKDKEYFKEYYKKNKSIILIRSLAQNKTPQYRFWKRWHNMNERCQNPKHNNYHLWGGRGIRVCIRWKLFKNFKEDMWESFLVHLNDYGSINTTLDRINVDKNYSMSNCKWATMKEQQNNRRNNT